MNNTQRRAALLAAAVLFATVAGPVAASPNPQQTPAEADGRAMYEGLRSMAFATTAADLGLPADSAAIGVIMEFAIDGETVSVLAFASGDASLYFSTGGGMIGGIGHPRIVETARSLVAEAGAIATALPKTEIFARPTGEEIRFYILTPEGVHTGSSTPERLASGQDPLSPLFVGANDIISGFRAVSERHAEGSAQP